jgi:hypothetical protein
MHPIRRFHILDIPSDFTPVVSRTKSRIGRSHWAIIYLVAPDHSPDTSMVRSEHPPPPPPQGFQNKPAAAGAPAGATRFTAGLYFV